MFLTRSRNKKSNVNLSHTSPTTLAPGNLIPISFVPVVGGDKLRFSPSAFVQAFPMNAPLVNGFKICFEYFFIPVRLYNSNLLLDFTGTTDDPDSVLYPALAAERLGKPAFDLSTAGDAEVLASKITSPGSLADYIGFPVGFGLPYIPTPVSTPKFNMVKVLGYLDVVYNYYVNQQIPKVPTAAWGPPPFTPGGSSVEDINVEFDVADIERFLRSIKTASDPVAAYASFTATGGLGSWQWLNSRKSIFQRCLPPYYLESWLKTSGYNDAEIKVNLEADGKTISMRNISAMSHIQRWIDLSLNGGRWSDFLNSEFDTARVKNHSTPIFLGADRQYLGSNVIYQTTGAGDSASPLGAFAGQASGGERFRKRVFNFDEPGYFMVMASLVPDVIYTRGLDPFLQELNLGDSYAPALDNISMEPLMLETLDSVLQGKASTSSQLNIVDSNYGKSTAVGFVPAWSKLMQQVSRAHGRLTTELYSWLLGRDYGNEQIDDNITGIRTTLLALYKEGSISYDTLETLVALLQRIRDPEAMDYSPYVRANAYNNVFADLSNQAQNFVLTFSCTASVYREKGKVNVSTTL